LGTQQRAPGHHVRRERRRFAAKAEQRHTGERWQWSITAIVGSATGWAETREEAQAQFAAAWRPWLGRTGLQEIP
jgi:hypothetical protein